MKFSKIPLIVIVLMLALVFAMPVLAASPEGVQVDEPPVTAEAMAAVLLGLVGVVMSAVFKYVPKWRTWYEGLPHQGIVMLGFVFVAGLTYFYLACTPAAAALGILIACEEASWVLLFQVIAYIVIGNQGAYLFLPKKG